MQYITILDILGTIVFAISGTMTALNNKFDLFGSLVIAFVTALGGGMLRDVLLGDAPVLWVKNPEYLLYVFTGYLLVLLFNPFILKLRKTLFLFDTIGIAIFTILGLEKTLELGFHPVIALTMGVISAVFGGVIRDLLTNIVPLIFRKEIYATACLTGGLCYLILENFNFNHDINIIATVVLIIIIRILAVRYKWSLTLIHQTIDYKL
ncbi:trimeric intracellular cation channel family protein [Membranihabitans maritimus]|uniref:trimeric intracellular cation channel family protein n=1 Tax=Membranihabitans maritimus TaxID=2904244 RepID=UPI001F454D0A|nr:trimeric intracellular cation channel family protein [Membranihabitans maritimus]